jgi:hypothetical protein
MRNIGKEVFDVNIICKHISIYIFDANKLPAVRRKLYLSFSFVALMTVKGNEIQ